MLCSISFVAVNGTDYMISLLLFVFAKYSPFFSDGSIEIKFTKTSKIEDLKTNRLTSALTTTATTTTKSAALYKSIDSIWPAVRCFTPRRLTPVNQK